MKKLILAIILLVTLSNLSAQIEKTSTEKKADEYYTEYSFDKAIESYLQVKDLGIDGQRRLAESYRNIDKNKEAEIVYAKIANSPGAGAEDFYNYSSTLRSNGKYEESGKWMMKFVALRPNDFRSKNYASDISKLTNKLKDDGTYKVVHLDLNTDAEDFGPSYYKNKVVFASSRNKGGMIKREYNWNRKPFLDMYVSDISGDQLLSPITFDKNLNGKLHDGPASFANESNTMAFTRNNYIERSKEGVVKLQIFFSNYKEGKWSEEEGFYLNNSEYSVGHPYLTSDGNTMYFASDMPGGFGGSDIYKTTKNEQGKWEKPKNLGEKINTEGNEMFPFYNETVNVLFFSSNGRLGLGGLDIFAVAYDEGKFGREYNLGTPLNTQADDFALITNDKFTKGYFSSNRVGGSGDDDIYFFELLKPFDFGKRIKGIAKDTSGNPIPNAFVELRDEKGNVVDTVTTKEDGKYLFYADNDRKYKLVGMKTGYFNGSSEVNTIGTENIVTADVILKQPKLNVGDDIGKIFQINPIYFDLDKYDIRADAALELDKIVKIMNGYPNMVIELGSHTDCRATKEYNQILSNNRAKSSSEYIQKRISNPKRIFGKGYGESKLTNGCACEGKVVSDCSEEEHQKNRRTEFIIVKK